jgi:phospholipid/cholesterol/gamma-HCH transport system ATP-binding protein
MVTTTTADTGDRPGPAAAVPALAPPNPAGPAVLELAGVDVDPPGGYDVGLADVTLALHAGDLAIVRLEPDAVRVPLADVACGLLDPDRGTVRYGGQEWRRMGFGRAARDRGRIGRVFEGVGWVGNLDVDENVLLPERHHTRRPDADLHAEAAELARAFGLPNGLPRTRPAQTRRSDLARAALVRAFLGRPPLLLLERPEAGAYPDVMPALVAAVQAARHRGAAVLWLTAHADVWRSEAARPTARYAMDGARLEPAETTEIVKGRRDQCFEPEGRQRH